MIKWLGLDLAHQLIGAASPSNAYRITLLGHRGLTYIGFDEILMGLSISETVQLGGARGLNLRLLPFIKEKNAFRKTHTNARFILLRSGLSGLREPLRCPFS